MLEREQLITATYCLLPLLLTYTFLFAVLPSTIIWSQSRDHGQGCGVEQPNRSYVLERESACYCYVLLAVADNVHVPVRIISVDYYLEPVS